MSEKAQRVSQKIQTLKANLRQFTGRPQATLRDGINQIRSNIGTKVQAWAENLGTNQQEDSQQQSPQVLAPQQGRPQQAQGGGRPTILGSLRGMLQQQQAPQQPQQQAPPMSAEEIAYQEERQRTYERERRAAEKKQRETAQAKKRKRLAIFDG